MTRILIASVVGAVVYFVWQMLTWMVIPLHGPTVSGLPNESAIRDAIIQQELESGVYIVPFGSDEEMMDPESQFSQRHVAGPLLSIFYHQDGMEPMMTSTLVRGAAIDFLSVGLASLLLSLVSDAKRLSTYVARVGFVTSLGVFLGLTGHVAYYNWMHFPADYTAMFVVDAVVGWFLVGLIVAAVVVPQPSPAE